jgi:hypothetical protein
MRGSSFINCRERLRLSKTMFMALLLRLARPHLPSVTVGQVSSTCYTERRRAKRKVKKVNTPAAVAEGDIGCYCRIATRVAARRLMIEVEKGGGAD